MLSGRHSSEQETWSPPLADSNGPGSVVAWHPFLPSSWPGPRPASFSLLPQPTLGKGCSGVRGRGASGLVASLPSLGTFEQFLSLFPWLLQQYLEVATDVCCRECCSALGAVHPPVALVSREEHSSTWRFHLPFLIPPRFSPT